MHDEFEFEFVDDLLLSKYFHFSYGLKQKQKAKLQNSKGIKLGTSIVCMENNSYNNIIL